MSWSEVAGLVYILFIIGMITIVVMSFVSFLIVPTMNPETVNITVIEKIPYHDGNYLIIAQKGDTEEVFRVSDVWVLGIFDASDRYAYLKPNTTYTTHVGGYRVPFLSWYRNINVIEGKKTY